MKHKRQHVVPKCYLEAWCDPDCPPSHSPYLWMVSKEGKQKKRKAPHNALTTPNAYTIDPGSGDRDLSIEDVFGKIESSFARVIRRKISNRHPLDSQDMSDLICFAAAMTTRVDQYSESLDGFLGQLQEQMAAMEEFHNSDPAASRGVADLRANVRPLGVGMSLEMLVHEYGAMSVALLLAPRAESFITSDSPMVWYNPQAHKLPPFYRSPGLAQKHIEVTMPITPWCMLFVSHCQEISGYIDLNAENTLKLNRRTRFHCDKWFIPWKGDIRKEWFDPGTPPEDRWENTAEGRRTPDGDAASDES